MDNVNLFNKKLHEFLSRLTFHKREHNVEHQLEVLLNTIAYEPANDRARLICIEWIIKAVAAWSSQRYVLPLSISRFALRLTSVLSKDEEKFCHLNNNNFFINLINVTKCKVSSGLKLHFIYLLSSFLLHKNGIDWVMACSFWEDVLELAMTGQNEDVTEKSHIFVATLLQCSSEHDKIFCEKVIKKMFHSLSESVYKFKKNSESEESIGESVKFILDLICDLLQHCLTILPDNKIDIGVPEVLWKLFQSESLLIELHYMGKVVGLELDKLQYIFQFVQLYVMLREEDLRETVLDAAVKRMRETFYFKISKGCFENMRNFCFFGLWYWNLITSSLPISSSENCKINCLRRSFLILPLLPGYCILLRCFPNVETFFEDDEIRNSYYQKLCENSLEDMIRLFYIWRDQLLSDPSDLTQLSVESLKCNIRFIKYLERDQAVHLLQESIYYLKDTIFVIRKSSQILNGFGNHFNIYFSNIFQLLSLLIESFSITWKDGCFETIDILDATFDFLTLFAWPTEAVINALKLINICICNYMTANLALLVDRTSDSTLSSLGPFVLTKLKNSFNPVRQATVEIVVTMSKMSIEEFPSLQDVVIGSNLPQVIAEMSTADTDSAVRALAIRALVSMIQVDKICKKYLDLDLLCGKIKKILLVETEDNVREEAICFLNVIYGREQFLNNQLSRIYKLMVYIFLNDSSWKVRLGSLSFWKKVIQNHLHHQGMIDGEFPEFTFSKNEKKIVTLTRSVVQKRLVKALEELNDTGCLQVLVHAVEQDCRKEVVLAASEIIGNLAKLFKKYKLLDAQDHLKTKPTCRRYVESHEFVTFACQDVDSVLSKRRNFESNTSNLTAILDKVLAIYEEDDVILIE